MISSKASVWNESRTMRTTFFRLEKANFPDSSIEYCLKLGVSGWRRNRAAP